MSEVSKAIFLSYASQDAEAAKRICDSLRATGVEVWFDVEGGLETGDEWDAKIRRQIKECVLFLPIVSANTQAREEGYFRIEWELAAQRSLGIAAGVAFILPVVIDETREAAALVPDRFRSVQWTRARGGELTPESRAKFAKLWSHRAGLAKHKQAVETAGNGTTSVSAAPGSDSELAPRRSRSFSAKTVVAALAGALLLGAGALWLLNRPKTVPDAAAVAQPVASASSAAHYPRDPELKRARALLFISDAIPDDFALAEDIIRPVVAQRPNDPEVAAVAAEVALEFLIRGFDLAPARRSQVQRLAERAVQLAPDNPYALAALGRYLLFIDAQMSRAEELTRRAIALKPDEARFHRTLYTILSRTRPAAEVNAFGERMAAQFPRDALVAYDIARRYKDENDIVEAEKWFDRTIAHESPPAFAYVWKSWIMLQVHGDLAAAKEWLDRVPERQRANTRVANARYLQALFSGDTAHALRALGEIPDEWLTDFDFTGPKALLIGSLHLRRGRTDLAKVELEAALALANAEIEKNPTDLFPRRAKMWALISLGRLDEARTIYPVLLQATRRPYILNLRNLSWTNTVAASLLLGYREDAITLLRESADSDANTRHVLRTMFKLDPRLALWRDDPEIVAVLVEPVTAAPNRAAAVSTPAMAVEEKSVAVLAFANLSDDKANEYFSDGISEELLNVLAKVPGLKVSARTSAFHFKGKNTPIPEIARQLGVAYVIEGSVRKAGDKVRITAQLIKAADGFRVWSETFTRGLQDTFAVQDEIAAIVARNLSLTLGAKAPAASVAVANRSAEVLPLYYAALQAWNLRTLEGLERAEALLNEVLAIDPAFARGHAALAAVWLIRGEIEDTLSPFGLREGNVARRVEAKLVEALRLDPECAEAYAVRGALGWDTWQWDRGLADLRRATQLNPNFASAHQWMGRILASQGRLDEAIASLRRATEVDPLSPRILDNYGRMLVFAGRAREAADLAERALQLQPSAVQAKGLKAEALVQLGEKEAAAELARGFPTGMPLLSIYKVNVLAVVGRPAELEAMLPHFQAGGHISRIAALIALGRADEALTTFDPDWITATRCDMLLYNPLFDSVRRDPRFAAALERLGLTEAHARAQAWRAQNRALTP